MEPLTIVHAYRDNGPMLGGLTRWKPRRVYCTRARDHADTPGTQYVVKYRQGEPGTAALISEVVCHALMEAARLQTLRAALVEVSVTFAASCRAAGLPYAVEPGLHFGTVYETDVLPGPPDDADRLSDPGELIDIWVLDSWLMNVDRDTYGNILMAQAPGAKWDLIPADQSDCLGGADLLTGGGYKRAALSRGTATSCRILEPVLFESGADRVRSAIERVDRARESVRAACGRIPDAWWNASGVEPDALARCLTERAHRMAEIVDVKRWEALGDASRGGHVLDI